MHSTSAWSAPPQTNYRFPFMDRFDISDPDITKWKFGGFIGHEKTFSEDANDHTVVYPAFSIYEGVSLVLTTTSRTSSVLDLSTTFQIYDLKDSAFEQGETNPSLYTIENKPDR